MKKEESFGVIPLSKQNGRWLVFLIQHAKGRYWGFPKGHGEEGETPQESAIRELKEETNLDLVHFIDTPPIVEEYWFQLKGERVHKRVVYFVAIVEGTISLQKEEIQDGAWVGFPETFDIATHPEAKTILNQVHQLILDHKIKG